MLFVIGQTDRLRRSVFLPAVLPFYRLGWASPPRPDSPSGIARFSGSLPPESLIPAHFTRHRFSRLSSRVPPRTFSFFLLLVSQTPPARIPLDVSLTTAQARYTPAARLQDKGAASIATGRLACEAIVLRPRTSSLHPFSHNHNSRSPLAFILPPPATKCHAHCLLNLSLSFSE